MPVQKMGAALPLNQDYNLMLSGYKTQMYT